MVGINSSKSNYLKQVQRFLGKPGFIAQALSNQPRKILPTGLANIDGYAVPFKLESFGSDGQRITYYHGQRPIRQMAAWDFAPQPIALITDTKASFLAEVSTHRPKTDGCSIWYPSIPSVQQFIDKLSLKSFGEHFVSVYKNLKNK